MTQKQIGLILMVLAAVCLALTTILMKLVPELTPMQPGHVAVWRFLIAAPMLWLVYVFWQSPSTIVPKRPWWFLGLGLVFSVANFSALFALDRLSSSIYVIIVYIYPSLVVVYALVGGKAVPRLYWFGLPLTFIGLVLITYEFGMAFSIDFLGFVITLINAIAMAVYLVLSEKVFFKVQDRTLGTNWVMLGALTTGLIMIPLVGFSTPDTRMGWILLISLGIFGTMFPVLLLNISLQLLGAARGSVIITLTPVVTVLFSTLFLSETLTIQQWVGGLLIILAIILLQRSPDRNRNKKDKGDYIDPVIQSSGIHH